MQAALFDGSGGIRPSALIALLVSAARVMLASMGGLSWFGSKPAAQEAVESVPDGTAKSRKRQGSTSSSKPAASKPPKAAQQKGKSIKQLQALQKRLAQAKEREPDSPLFWKAFRSKLRDVTASSLSAGSGKRGPAWVVIAESDLSIKAQLLKRDGSGDVEFTVSGTVPSYAGVVTAIAICGVDAPAPSTLKTGSKSSKRPAAAAPTGSHQLAATSATIVAATSTTGLTAPGGARHLLVWKIAVTPGKTSAELAEPIRHVDVSAHHTAPIQRIWAVSTPPGRATSCVALTLAVGSASDNSLLAFSTEAQAARTGRAVKRATPVSRAHINLGSNTDVCLSPGRRWAAASSYMAVVRVVELHHTGDSSSSAHGGAASAASGGASLAGASFSRLSVAASLPLAAASHKGAVAGIVFPHPGVAPYLSGPTSSSSSSSSSQKKKKGGSAGGVLELCGVAGACGDMCGDSSRAVVMGANGRWSVWDLSVKLSAGEVPGLLAQGTVDLAALARAAAVASGSEAAVAPAPTAAAYKNLRVTALRALPGSPCRVVVALRGEGGGDTAGRWLASVVLVAETGGSEGFGRCAVAAPRAEVVGDAVCLSGADLSGLGPISQLVVSDPVSDAVPESLAICGVGSDARHSVSHFANSTAKAAAAWPGYVMTSHTGAKSAKTWKFPALRDEIDVEST
jgi:hypothetical protein